jgi:hypothetical protein
MHPGLLTGCFFMKGPLLAILVIILLALSSFWVITSTREVRERKKVELNVRKLALSIQLDRDQERLILEIELNRRNRVRQLRDSLERNGKALSKALQDLSRRYTFQIEGVLDSLQKLKYKKYRKALASKRARKLKLVRKSQSSG